MRSKISSLLALCLLTSSIYLNFVGGVLAQSNEVFDAAMRSPKVKIAAKQFQIAVELARQSFIILNPEVSAFVNATIDYDTSSNESKLFGSLGVRSSVTLYDGGVSNFERASKKALVDARYFELIQVLNNEIFLAHSLLANAEAAKFRAEQTEIQTALSAFTRSMISSRIDAEDATNLDLAQAEANFAVAQSANIIEQGKYADAAIRLHVFWGSSEPNSERQSFDFLASVPTNEIVNYSKMMNPGLKAQRARILAAQLNTKALESKSSPKLRAMATVGLSDSSSTKGELAGTVGVVFSIPTNKSGLEESRLRAARDLENQERSNLEAITRSIAGDIEFNAKQIQLLNSAISDKQEQATAIERILDDLLSFVELDGITAVEVANTQRDLHDVRMEIIDLNLSLELGFLRLALLGGYFLKDTLVDD